MDLVTFGEAMVRLTPPNFQRLEQTRTFDAYVGGGELNVAVAASRLGLASRWVSRLPENALGRMIANAAREQGVDAHVEWTADDRAGLYFAELGSCSSSEQRSVRSCGIRDQQSQAREYRLAVCVRRRALVPRQRYHSRAK